MYWLILILFVVLIIYIFIKFRKPKNDTLLGYCGTQGSGKSFSMTSDVVSNYYKSKSYWGRYNKPILRKVLYLIPYFNKKRLNHELYGLERPHVYSSYPILLGSKRDLKKYSYDLKTLIDKDIISHPLDNDILFERKSVPVGSQIVIDEISSWVDQYEFKEEYSKNLEDFIQKIRHYLGNKTHFYCADQCSNRIVNQIRYCLNKINVCIKTKHILGFIHITYYKEIQITDDIKNIEVVDNDNADTDDKYLRIIRFGFTRRYDDRAYSNRYFYIDENEKHSKMINSIFKTNNTLKRPNKKGSYINIDTLISQYEQKQKEINVKYEKEDNSKNDV